MRADMADGKMPRRTRKDLSQSGIVAALRNAGAAVTIMDYPIDLLVSYRGVWLCLESKTPCTQYGKKLNDNQEAWKNKQKAEVFLVHTPEQALSILSSVNKA